MRFYISKRWNSRHRTRQVYLGLEITLSYREVWDSFPMFPLWRFLWRNVNWWQSNVFDSWVISIFPLFFSYAVIVRKNTAQLVGGKDRGAKLLQSSTFFFYTLINPWLALNVFSLCFLTLWRTPRCGWSVILAIVQLMPVVLALLCFAVRGFSSDLCHIKMRCAITEVRCNGSVQQEECLSFLCSLALISWRVDSLLLRSTRRDLCCSFAAVAVLLSGSWLADPGLRISTELQPSFLVQRQTKPLQGLAILGTIIWQGSI